jgi:hypothetical protein
MTYDTYQSVSEVVKQLKAGGGVCSLSLSLSLSLLYSLICVYNRSGVKQRSTTVNGSRPFRHLATAPTVVSKSPPISKYVVVDVVFVAFLMFTAPTGTSRRWLLSHQDRTISRRLPRRNSSTMCSHIQHKLQRTNLYCYKLLTASFLLCVVLQVQFGGKGALVVRVAADNNATVWFDGIQVCLLLIVIVILITLLLLLLIICIGRHRSVAVGCARMEHQTGRHSSAGGALSLVFHNICC